MNTQDINDVLELQVLFSDNGFDAAGRDPKMLSALLNWKSGGWKNGGNGAAKPSAAQPKQEAPERKPTSRGRAKTTLPEPPPDDDPGF
jgi:hypothetical protein